MCAQMLPPDMRSYPLRGNRMRSEQHRDPVARWSKMLSTINVVFAALTVLLWGGSPLVLALGAIILFDLLALAVVLVLVRQSRR